MPIDRLYLAYGANLNVRSMVERCPGAKAEGKRIVDNARLVFRGCADVEYHPGAKTPMGLWRINAEHEAALDRFEGVPSFYGKYYVPLDDGSEALIYLMHDQGIFPPSEYYLRLVAQGYKDFHLPMHYLKEAVARSYLEKEHSPGTRMRRERQKRSTNQARLVKMPEDIALQRISRRQQVAAAETPE